MTVRVDNSVAAGSHQRRVPGGVHPNVAEPVTIVPSEFGASTVIAVVPVPREVATPAGAPGTPVILIGKISGSLDAQVTGTLPVNPV